MSIFSKIVDRFNLKRFWTWTTFVYAACAGALVLFFFVTNGVLINISIPSTSMVSTINAGDKLLGVRSWLVSYDRGDIVIFQHYDGRMFCKRIVGMPGETVEIKAGTVYINGTRLDEPYLGSFMEEDVGPFEIPDDSYFVMGDNRAYSSDSREWDIPYVESDQIRGKLLWRYSPNIERVK